ncbi:AE-binding protein [Lachnotalea glycerini]|uniref:AE-binding protein n=1 Tax=Lachnotalea glycerini TaxID=1763509 RepID=A0A371JDG4_9FIRM|nr:AE-binding protein [Lachnotalea glycerini]RDY30697.1 AE-binding protein [Lachnotalea glycerini]
MYKDVYKDNDNEHDMTTDEYTNKNKPEINYPPIKEPLPESTRPRKDGPGGN